MKNDFFFILNEIERIINPSPTIVSFDVRTEVGSITEGLLARAAGEGLVTG